MAISLACKSSDVDISPESDKGSGPVDFKFSRGHHAKVLVELKLANSSSLRRNATYQVPTYARAESANTAFLMVFQTDDKHLKDQFVEDTEKLVAERGNDENIDYRVIWVDARRKPSASKRRE